MTSPQQPHPHVRLDRDGPVLSVILSNPARRNAQTPSMWAALAEVADTLPPEVRVVVLRADGPSFSAGLDRGMLAPEGIDGEPNLVALAAHGDPGPLADAIGVFQRGFTAWRHCAALVVAAVQGHAVGAGFQLALAADLRVVADDVSFVMGEVALGLVPDLGGTGPLARLVGPARALEICLTSRPVGAQEAVALGLAQLAVPAADLDATVRDLAAAVLAAPEQTVRELVPLLRGALERTPAEQLAAERQAQSRILVGLVEAMRRG